MRKQRTDQHMLSGGHEQEWSAGMEAHRLNLAGRLREGNLRLGFGNLKQNNQFIL